MPIPSDLLLVSFAILQEVMVSHCLGHEHVSNICQGLVPLSGRHEGMYQVCVCV